MNRAGVGMLLGILLAGLGSSAMGQEIRWYHNLAEAKKVAKEKGLPLFVDVGTDNCFWCKKLDTTTFRDPEVIRLVGEHFIPVKVDASKDPGWAHSMGISAFPTLLFTRPDGTQIHRENGYADAGRMRGILTRLKPTDSNFAVTSATAREAPANSNVAAPTHSPTLATPVKIPALPRPAELGVSTIPVSWVKADGGPDLPALFSQMRELGVVGMRVERLNGGFKARLEMPAGPGKNRVLEGSGPSENAALAQALSAAAKSP